MEKVNIAIIGAGYWGKNLIRTFNSLSGVNLKYVCDIDKEKLISIKNFYPKITVIEDSEVIFNDDEVSAILIAVPTRLHYPLAKKSLESGKHVFVEKPMTETYRQAEELVEIANKKGLVLSVDHTFLYTGAVRKIKELIDSEELGEIRYFDSERINLGLIQPDINVIYDLAAHDISILNFIFNEEPKAISAFGNSFITKNSNNKREEIAHINLEYGSGLVAHIHVSWLSPVKLRKMLIGGSKKMILYNDVEPSEKIKIFNHRVEAGNNEQDPFFPVYRSGEILIPKIESREALKEEADDFILAIKEGRKSFTDGLQGAKIVYILEKATESIRAGGERRIL